MTFLPFALPSIGEEEIAEVVDTLRSGWLTTGPKARQFEKDFAAFIGAAHALPTSFDGRLVGTWGDLTVYSFHVTNLVSHRSSTRQACPPCRC